MRLIKKFKPFFGIFCLFTLGLTGCNLKSNKEEEPVPVQTEPSFDIEADKNVLLLDKNEKITISVIKLVSISDSELKSLEMAISSEINTCEGEITKSSTLGDFYFTAKKPGEAEISASIRTASGKVSAKSKIKVNAAYSTNVVKERIASVLTDKPILGENYDIGVSKNDLNNYSIANADGFLRFDEEGKLEVCGFGLIYPKISYKNEVLFDRSCQIFISTICTEIRESLYNQGKIDRKEDNVPNSLLKYVTSVNMSNVIINNPECALGIKYLENLEEIDLSNNELEELDFLSPLTKLKKINFAHNNIKDLSPLYRSEMTLEEINLSDNNATSLSTLATFTKLKILDISENRISDIDFLSGVDSLVYLNLNHNNITKFIDGLSGLYSLKSLSLAYTGLNFVDIRSLKYLNQLDYLDISGSSSSLNQLTSYTNMKGLRVADCNLSQQSLTVLNEFTHLEILDISNNSLMNEKIDRELNASVLANIKELSIGGNEFSEIPSIIKNFTNLDVLDLTNSYNITAIDQLKDLGIKELVLDECNSIGNDLLSNTMYAEQYLRIINSLTNLEKLSIVGGLNYMTKQVFDSLDAKVRSGTLSLRFLDDLYVDKNNISDYSTDICFSMNELLSNCVLDAFTGIYTPKSENRNLAISLVNDDTDNATENKTFFINKTFRKIDLYGDKNKTYNISFNLEDRKDSTMTFNLISFMNVLTPGKRFYSIKTDNGKIKVNSIKGSYNCETLVYSFNNCVKDKGFNPNIHDTKDFIKEVDSDVLIPIISGTVYSEGKYKITNTAAFTMYGYLKYDYNKIPFVNGSGSTREINKDTNADDYEVFNTGVKGKEGYGQAIIKLNYKNGTVTNNYGDFFKYGAGGSNLYIVFTEALKDGNPIKDISVVIVFEINHKNSNYSNWRYDFSLQFAY